MLQGEHSAILSTFIEPPFVFKTFVLFTFGWLLKTVFTVKQLFFLISISYKDRFRVILNTHYPQLMFWWIDKKINLMSTGIPSYIWRSVRNSYVQSVSRYGWLERGGDILLFADVSVYFI